MKIPFNARAPTFDAKSITDTIQRALASAGLDTNSGPIASVTETIRQALSSSGVTQSPKTSAVDDSVIDVPARVVSTAGSFESFTHRGAFGARDYKVYVPAKVNAQPALIVMLHGCTQSASDFAAGTQMNRQAEAHGFVVVYPEQSAGANVSKCWNWFKTEDQVRDSGEAGLLAGLVREVALRHQVDMRRIYVAGLSAGAAMAVVLGQTYPELFAGVGAHSGLPYASAHDIPSAMAAMKGGRGMSGANVAPSAHASQASRHAVPTIVFHGDRDHTVQHSNGIRIVDDVSAAFNSERGGTAATTTNRGTKPGGHSYSTVVQTGHTGAPQIESWTVHGAGHAWSGGESSGSYTDGAGPDASAEMVRFFLALPRAGSA